MVLSVTQKFAAVASLSLLITLFLPVLLSAGEKEDLERLIERTNTKRSTPEKVSEFAGKVKDYYDIGIPVVEGLLKEFKPGEVLTIIAISDLSKKDVDDIAKMRKDGMKWQDITDKSGITMAVLIKDINTFQRISG